MSKSLGNFFTVREILDRYEGRVLRFFMLSAHYRSPLNFSDDLMESAKASVGRIVTCEEAVLARCGKIVEKADLSAAGEETAKALTGYREAFCTAMDDDFNTADALAAVFDLVRYINTNIAAASDADAAAMNGLLHELTGVLGLDIEPAAEEADAEIEALIAQRQAARKAKDFAKADAIRDELLGKGIILEDTREGVKWKRA